MRDMINGFTGWLKLNTPKNESIKVLDTAITVIATLLVATTWAIVRHHSV